MIVKAPDFDTKAMSVSAALNGKTWSEVYGSTLPEPSYFTRYWWKDSGGNSRITKFKALYTFLDTETDRCGPVTCDKYEWTGT